jgi:[acyl-carrier-protein] S-malonyltransferase
MKFTALFPGQGSQQPGMGKALFESETLARQTFEEASDALSFDLKKLCFEGSESDLALTENTQPALLTNSVATVRVYQKKFGLNFGATAGHSIGEYSSFVLGGVIPFSTALKAVRLRGKAMQNAVPVGKGSMAAVMGLEPDQVIQLCEMATKDSKTGPISAANFNAPGQIVISGSALTLEWLGAQKIETFFPEVKRFKMIPLKVSAPFHCALMQPAEDQMRDFFTPLQFENSQLPILQNYHAKFETEAGKLKENLIRQVTGSVLWMQSMEALKLAGMTTCIEFGSGKVLAGLLKKIDSESFKVFNTTSSEDMKMLEDFLKNGVQT